LEFHHPIPAVLGDYVVLKNRVSATIQDEPFLVLNNSVVDNLWLGTGGHPNANARLLEAVATHLSGGLPRQHQAHHPIAAELVALQQGGARARHIHAAIATTHKLVLPNGRTPRFND
jgi:hypothetical protein